jgi:hypothetical protein
MAAAQKPDKSAERHPYGSRPLAALLPAVTRSAFRRRSPMAARLLMDWDAIVGPALAAVTAPERCASGTLSLACAGPVALELQHLAPKLIERINGHVGRPLVRRLRFHQVPVSPLPAKPPAKPPRPATEAVVAARLAGIPEGELRDALARLGHAIAGEA